MYKSCSGQWILYTVIILFCAVQRLRCQNVYRFELVVRSKSIPQILFKFDATSDEVVGDALQTQIPKSFSFNTSNGQSTEIAGPEKPANRPENDIPLKPNVQSIEIEKPEKPADRPENNIPLMPNVQSIEIEKPEKPADRPENNIPLMINDTIEIREGFPDSSKKNSITVPVQPVKMKEQNSNEVQPLASMPSRDGINNRQGLEDSSENNSITVLNIQLNGTEDALPQQDCILPTNIRNTSITLTNPSNNIEDTFFTNSNGITLRYLSPSGVQTLQDFICQNATWVPTAKLGIRNCPSLSRTETYSPNCNFRGLDVKCETSVDGTLAWLACNTLYDDNDSTNIICKGDGAWYPTPAPCKPDCGRGCAEPMENVINGEPSQTQEYPWLVGIYDSLSSGQPRHTCSGSLISRSYILSAAHCITNNLGTVQPVEEYIVAAGKQYRDIVAIKEQFAQVRRVKRFTVHERFRGSINQYRDDIALIELREEFNIKPNVQLVCVDWDNVYEDQEIVPNTTAKIAGWGFTKMDSQPANVLQKLVISYGISNDCQNTMDRQLYNEQYTNDKICAGFKNEDNGVCKGDGGAGLYFESVSCKFYVRGVASLSQRSNTGACDTNHYVLFTRVSNYTTWIRDTIGENV